MVNGRDEAWLTIDAPVATPGSTIGGHAVGHDPATVSVQLVKTEITAGAIGKAITTEIVVAEAPIDAVGSFDLAVPVDAVPGFRVTASSRAGSELAWTVRIVDSEGEAIESVAVDLSGQPSESISQADLTVIADAVDQMARSTRRSDLQQTGGLMAIFVAVGAACLAFGIAYVFNPPEAWNGDTGPAWWAIGFGLFMLPLPVFWFFNRVRPAKVKGARIVSVSSPVRRGGVIDVELAVDPGTTVRVGHVLQHYGTNSMKIRPSGTGPGVRYDVENWWDWLTYENWSTASADDPIVRFEVPADAAPSYAGRSILNAHLIRVHSAGAKSSRLSTRRLEKHVIVLG